MHWEGWEMETATGEILAGLQVLVPGLTLAKVQYAAKAIGAKHTRIVGRTRLWTPEEAERIRQFVLTRARG